MQQSHTQHPSYQTLVLRLQPELHAAALRYTRNEGDAEDLVQETLLKAYVAWRTFLPGASARAWCHRILRNTFISAYRRRVTERQAARLEGEELRRITSAGTRRDAEHPELALEREQVGDEVTAALADLPIAQREVLERYHWRGQSYQEIARSLRLPVGTVMSRLHRGRRALRDRLAEYARSQGIASAAPQAA
jgi:RNA polymerase sigma-70 factor (ECF subfamily)